MAFSLTKELPRDWAPPINYSHIQVKASTTIFAGQVVATDDANHAGLAVPYDSLGTFTSARFLGFASNTVVQTATSTLRVRLITHGRTNLPGTVGAQPGDTPLPQDAVVYATNDNTFTTSSSGIAIGKIKQLGDDAAGREVIVAIESLAMRSV